MKSFQLLSVCLLTSLLFAFNPTTAQNDKLPSIELYDVDGKKINLSSFSENGKVTVLNFWATWCTPCKKELNNIADLYEDWQADYDVEVVAISIDDARNKAKVKTYVNGQAWEYTVLLDPNGDLKRLLNFQTVPFTVIVDKDGNIVDKHSGYIEGDEYELEDKIAKLSK